MKTTVNVIRIALLIVACLLSLAFILGILEYLFSGPAQNIDPNLLKELLITTPASILLWYFFQVIYRSIEQQ